MLSDDDFIKGLRLAQNYAAHLLSCESIDEETRTSDGFIDAVNNMIEGIDKLVEKAERGED